MISYAVFCLKKKRIAVDPDTEEDHEFLVALAARLGIDQSLAAEIDAAARSVAT